MEPIERVNFPVKLLNYKHVSEKFHNPEDLSRSLLVMRREKEKVADKVTELSPRMNKSTILSGSGQQSLSSSVTNLH